MAFKDFEKHLKGATAAAIVLAATIRVEAKELQQKQKDVEKPKTEQVAKPIQKQDEKTIDFFGVAGIKQVKQDGQTYHLVDDKEVVTPEMLNENKLKREFKKDEKELWKNAEENRIYQDAVPLSEVRYAGVYSLEGKNITMPYLENNFSKEGNDPLGVLEFEIAKHSGLFDMAEEHNNPESLRFKSTFMHESQHQNGDKMGIYAPGLAAEEYAVLNQYDEVRANIAELKVYTDAYQEQIKNGVSKEEALKVFDSQKAFTFYKEAIENGLNPSSKEGEQKMVGGCFDLWNNTLIKADLYKNQLTGIGKNNVEGNSFAALAVGDSKELDKRIDKLFKNVDGKNFREFLPEKRLTNPDEINLNISCEVRDKTGLNQEDREVLGAKGVSKKDALKVLTGRKPADKLKSQKDNSSQINSNTMLKDNLNQR